jgi:hypothetical protein
MAYIPLPTLDAVTSLTHCAQTVDYRAGGGGISQNYPKRRDAVSVASTGALYSGGLGCARQHAHGVCNGCPAAGTRLRTGETLRWTSGPDNSDAHRDATGNPSYHQLDRSDTVAGWELCFAY